MPNISSASVNSVRQYLQEIGRYPLLTHEQEVAYGQAVQRMLHCEERQAHLAQELGRSPSVDEWASSMGMSRAELQQLLQAGRRAKQRMIESNLRLVVSVAKKYQQLNMELLDLLQEGGIGLQRAVEKFDPTKGYRFSTYAYWWIRQAMTRSISDQSRTIRLPIHLTEKLVKIRKVQRQLAAQLGRSATIAEVAAVLNFQPQQIREFLLQSRQPFSLDVKIGDDRTTELGDLLEDEGPTPDDYAVRSCLREDVERWMRDLTPQQVQVIQLRYGLTNQPPMTLQQISGLLNLTRERIRQIEKAAMHRLRQRQHDMISYLAG